MATSLEMKSAIGNWKSAMKARLVWLLLCGIWGSTWLFIKLGLEDLPPVTFAGIRFVIACAILVVWIGLRRM
ncbi:MAG TPA: EamA family transporter, partial [Pyrinomonadaceae bacterium]|nr:EamA family transporter [Pyrinomonadaceae bacterium]